MKNKIALVTGGSRGLGRDMAISLSKKGIDVILTYHTNQTDAPGSGVPDKSKRPYCRGLAFYRIT